MPIITKEVNPGEQVLLMGNEAIARGALEAGVKVVASYPGTPSSEIPKVLGEVADECALYVEWSVNEKVAIEVAAAGSYSGLRSMCVMKQVGVNVAADFLLLMAQYGTRGGMVLLTCEDPGALSSSNEGDSRPYSKMMEFPLIEPGDFQEAKDMTKWAFELSEEIHNVVMLRSVTRMSHASGNITFGDIPQINATAEFRHDGDMMDQLTGPVLTFPTLVPFQRQRQHQGLEKARELFEKSPFNTYTGPEEPELLVITSSAATFYCKEAIKLLGLKDRVGLLKLGTTWPLPTRLLKKHLSVSSQVFIVEEGTPFMEDNIKTLFAENFDELGTVAFFGRKDGLLPAVNELNPDLVLGALMQIMGCDYEPRSKEYKTAVSEMVIQGAPERSLTFCPGCPHRASFWLLHEALALDNRRGFICGDVGCNTMGAADCGFHTLKTVMAMGSGIGMASGFAMFNRFGMTQPVMALCGDSTFFHASMTGLVNAVHNQANLILVVVDNSGTAMTGFQPHPGSTYGADKKPLPALEISKICEAMGARVVLSDPFDFQSTRENIRQLMDEPEGVRVLILKQDCALSPGKKGSKAYSVSVDQEACLSDSCGCNRLCTRVFKCPGLVWDPVARKTVIDEFVCVGCGVCESVCPQGAIINSMEV